MPKPKPQPPLTKKRFERILARVLTTPVPELADKRAVGQAKMRTSESRPFDGCIEIRKSQDSLEGKGG